MAKISWKNSTSPSEIMSLIEDSEAYNKYTVLNYFVSKNDIVMIEKLLKSGYYTPEELATRDARSYSRWNKGPARQMVLEFVGKVWRDLDNVDEILKTRSSLCLDDLEDFLMKLSYFEKHNSKIYYQLLSSYRAHKYKLYLFEDPKKNKKTIYNILMICPQFCKIDQLLKLQHIFTEVEFNKLLNAQRQYVIKNFNDICGFNLLGYKKLFTKDEFTEIQKQNIIKNVKNLSRFELLQYKNLFTKDEFSKLLSVEKEWKTETEAELIMYRATPENKWEILEYFANKDENIFKSIVKYYTKRSIISKKVEVFLRDEVLEHYKDANLDNLPPVLKDYINSLKESVLKEEELKIQKQEERAQAKEERLLSWEDENGFTIVLFKIGSITPKSKADYEKVLKKYIDENLGITAFCTKYKISDSKGFKTMLEKFSAENSTYAEQIESKSTQQKAKFVDKVRDIIESVCVEGESVESIIKYSKTFSFERLQEFARKLFPNKNYCETLTIKVIEYYHNRLNSYTNSVEPENIANMLTRDEIRFIVGDEEYTDIMTGKKCEIEKVFLKRVSFLNATQPALIRQKVNSQRPDSIIKCISKYDNKFKKNEYFKSTTFILTESGEQIEVTKEMVDMAYQYAYSKKLHTSDAVMNYLIRAVANGKIQNVEETKQDRKEMMSQTLALVNEITNIDEYFKAIDSISQ